MESRSFFPTSVRVTLIPYFFEINGQGCVRRNGLSLNEVKLNVLMNSFKEPPRGTSFTVILFSSFILSHSPENAKSGISKENLG